MVIDEVIMVVGVGVTKIQAQTLGVSDTKAILLGIVVEPIGFMLRMPSNANRQRHVHSRTKLNPEPEGEARKKKL